MDPLVEPAEALTITAPKSTSEVSEVHSLKSLLANPVVVIIDTVLKTALRTASLPPRMSALRSSMRTISEATASSTR